MTWWQYAGLGAALFTAVTVVDFAGVRYQQAVTDGRPWAASWWTAIQWGVNTTALVVAVKITLWLLPCEVAGLVAGTQLAIRRTPKYHGRHS